MKTTALMRERLRDFVRGHGVVSTREVKARFGLEYSLMVSKMAQERELVLLARGVAAMPYLTTESPEYEDFLERRRQSMTSETATLNERIMAWGQDKERFTAGEAVAEFGIGAYPVLRKAAKAGDMEQLGKGAYRCVRSAPALLQPRRRIPEADYEYMRRLVRRKKAFRSNDMPFAFDRKTSMIVTMIARGDIVRVTSGVYALPECDEDSPEVQACIASVQEGRPSDMNRWMQETPRFTPKEVLAKFGSSASSTFYRRIDEGLVRRVSRGVYEWAGSNAVDDPKRTELTKVEQNTSDNRL